VTLDNKTKTLSHLFVCCVDFFRLDFSSVAFVGESETLNARTDRIVDVSFVNKA